MSPRFVAPPTALAPILSACVLPALAKKGFQDRPANRAGLFPGVQFKRIFHFPKAAVFTGETGEPPAAVTAFYKKDLRRRGRDVQADAGTEDTASVLLPPTGRSGIVGAQRGLPGRTGFSLSL